MTQTKPPSRATTDHRGDENSNTLGRDGTSGAISRKAGADDGLHPRSVDALRQRTFHCKACGQENDFVERIVELIDAWVGVGAPNDAAFRFAAQDLATSISAFELMRGQSRFDCEPSAFEAALAETKEAGAKS